MLDHTAQNQAQPKLQRAVGKLVVSSANTTANGSQLKDLRQQGSFRVIFPRSPDDSVHAVMINTAGGVTGGDYFSIEAQAHAASNLTLTTQAAERVYAAVGQDAGLVETRLCVEDGARLNWLPQETILFDNCNFDRRLDVSLAPDAEFLMVEPLIFGREASGETVNRGSVIDRVTITRGGTPIYVDRIALTGDIAEQIASPAQCAGARALATLVLCAPDAERYLDPVRSLLPHSAGASLLQDDILVVRMLAPASFELRRALLPVLNVLTNGTVPKNWRL